MTDYVSQQEHQRLHDLYREMVRAMRELSNSVARDINHLEEKTLELESDIIDINRRLGNAD